MLLKSVEILNRLKLSFLLYFKFTHSSRFGQIKEKFENSSYFSVFDCQRCFIALVLSLLCGLY